MKMWRMYCNLKNILFVINLTCEIIDPFQQIEYGFTNGKLIKRDNEGWVTVRSLI